MNYIIPMYQRNYAWEEGEITQLIQDVIDYMPKRRNGHVPEERNYYIGTLVVSERREDGRILLETIDGQQRLTTLSLLASYLKNETKGDFSWYDKLRIHFESRENSRKTFAAIFEGRISAEVSGKSRENEINAAILNGYRLIKKVLPQKLKENGVTCPEFADYLFRKVQIMRVKVPDDTDLNHYFEIMNSRGEQLEKHEVLKSHLMGALDEITDETEREESKDCLHLVWEACANMERYVQMGFTPGQRNAIFGDQDWGGFEPIDFDALREALRDSGDNGSRRGVAATIDEIILGANGSDGESEGEGESPERFNTVINFPNFLLHVLRVETQADIPLDDKSLITTFGDYLLKVDGSIESVKKFTFSLLKGKYLLDQYVLKREFLQGTDGWSLKRFKWNDGGARNRSGRGSYVNTFGDEDGNGDENRRILMLLSAFHVSTPTQDYKHWLNAALNWLFRAKEVDPKAYLAYLESVARAFVFDRFLVHDGGLDYFTIVYTNGGGCQRTREDVSDLDFEDRTSFGNIDNNLVFNYLDYLLWVNHRAEDSTVNSYEFTFRSSVEHYYPQNPMLGYAPLPPAALNSFGNLCLISHSKNSRLSNFMPQAKKEYYRNNTIDSIKQHLMMQSAQWNEERIARHYDEMKAVLVGSLENRQN